MPHSDNPLIRRFIEDAGNLSQSFGVGRVLGQIYAYLYFSPSPRTLSDMTDALGISKGSASMGVRQLAQWGAVQRMWVKGDRKDYYQATDWFGRILKNAMLDTVGKRLEAHTSLLADAQRLLHEAKGQNGDETVDEAFIKDRLDHLRAFHKKVQSLWGNPLLKLLLK